MSWNGSDNETVRFMYNSGQVYRDVLNVWRYVKIGEKNLEETNVYKWTVEFWNVVLDIFRDKVFFFFIKKT